MMDFRTIVTGMIVAILIVLCVICWKLGVIHSDMKYIQNDIKLLEGG